MRRLEENLEQRKRNEQHRITSGAIPVNLKQLHGVEPISAADLARLEAWMREHG